MTITFIHNNKAFLPEVHAYARLFGSLGINCQTALPQDVEKIDTDVEWHFIGLDTGKPKGRIKIHEYASGSIGPLRAFKNLSKKLLNVKPDFRLFLNPYVKKRFGFDDGIPFGYRDMGINTDWMAPTGSFPGSYQYDFVYIGDLSPARRPEGLLDVFTHTSLKDKTLLVISSNYSHLQTKYRHYSNIIFKGPCEHSVIRSMLLEARYGINYIIDKEPFSRQTSTKFLEYAACGLPVISTQYTWIEEFSLKYGGQYFYLNNNMSNFTWEAVQAFTFSPPDLSGWTWEKQIKASGVLEFLDSKFTDSSVSLLF